MVKRRGIVWVAGSRMLRGLLGRDGITLGRKHVTTPMRRMGIEALYWAVLRVDDQNLVGAPR